MQWTLRADREELTSWNLSFHSMGIKRRSHVSRYSFVMEGMALGVVGIDGEISKDT